MQGIGRAEEHEQHASPSEASAWARTRGLSVAHRGGDVERDDGGELRVVTSSAMAKASQHSKVPALLRQGRFRISGIPEGLPDDEHLLRDGDYHMLAN